MSRKNFSKVKELIELKVAPEDVGKVIGKQGRNIQAIRVVLGAAGTKLRKRFILVNN